MPKKKTTAEFIAEARKVHGDKYDYSKVDYQGIYQPVRIICPVHGEFVQRPYNHLSLNCGCRKCADDANAERLRKGFDYFLSEAK